MREQAIEAGGRCHARDDCVGDGRWGRSDTSPDGSTWTASAAGTFDASNRAKYNEVTPTAGMTGVNFVRFQILGNQTPDFLTNCPDGNFSGCSFADLTELEVFGQPSL
ncbi:MAG: hypothetical protein ABJA86_09150 [Nocardioidaceae bacterium]